ncbi:DJ-1 family glyoxalase III [Eubacterium sp.]|uniref:DJ-1 family glyoxalase III n=2 Tax=Eubacterium sp. TaxID=142586 RepID=UPI0025BA7934|nr:DJ-1 family glyoxalase III [Eubacterium sp.]MCI7801097.1 DJ-1/PfpI family protein [Eubacterium sp.]
MVYVFLADGFEIIEALAPVDMLRRAKIDVKTVGVSSEIVTSSCGVGVKCDMTIDEFDFYDVEAVVLPGGMPGTLNLENSSAVQKVIDNANNTNAFICAICAAPSILGHKGLLSGKKAVCFPGFENSLEGCESCCEYVVTDGKFITAKGAGVCIDFGLEIVKQLRNEELANEIRKSIQSR